MKTLHGALVIAALLLVVTLSLGWLSAQPKAQCNVTWYGQTGEYMLEQVRKDLRSDCKVVVVELMSFGGPVHTSIAIAQEIRAARTRGMVVEMHGRTVVVSGGVIVLGAGTPGRRFIDAHSIVLVHGVQMSNGWERKCAALVPTPTTEDDKFTNRFIEIVAEDLALSSGKPLAETLLWTECGKEQVGGGYLLAKLGLADNLE